MASSIGVDNTTGIVDVDLENGGSSIQSSAPPFRRNRVQLSCTHCRTAKLKCDRQAPCNQCTKKGRAAQCAFPAPMPRKKPAVSMQRRLKHLESLVKDVMTSQTPPNTNETTENGFEGIRSDSLIQNFNKTTATPNYLFHSDSARSFTAKSDGNPSGSVIQGTKETAYIGATHWAAILENIEEVKNYFDDNDSDDLVPDVTQPDISLVFQHQSPANIEELLMALPHRPIVDVLVSRYFQITSPTKQTIHRPSFQNQYKEFWDDPKRTPLAWLALLYAMISLATFNSLSKGDDIPDKRATPTEMIATYRRYCSQCLILSNYTKPGQHTLTALVVYMEGEFIVSVHDQTNCYVMLGVIIRLGLRLGLHRDATKISGDISMCQAELRRRMWYILFQMDHLVSFHIGLPAMMPAIESDTNWPRNLRDEDFDEESTELPAGRPDSECTPMSYTICKGGMTAVFGQIAVQANRLTLPSHDEVMLPDHSLNEAFAKVPAFFRVVPLELAITDSTEIIIQRFSIAVLYHKSRCVLHRKYLMMERDDHKFAYSKAAGLDSSVQLLRFQSSIHDAVKPGGLLSREKWFISSLSIHDFLLAATIIYLHLIQAIETTQGINMPIIAEQNRDMINLLRRSHSCWIETQEVVSEAKKAANVLELMVSKIDMAIMRFFHATQASVTENSSTDSLSGLSLEDQLFQDMVDGNTSKASWPLTTTNTTPYSGLGLQFDSTMLLPGDAFGNMLDMPMNFDWDTFDNHVRSQSPAVQESWLDLSMPNFSAPSCDDYFNL